MGFQQVFFPLSALLMFLIKPILSLSPEYEYDHLNYSRPVTSIKPHYHRTSDALLSTANRDANLSVASSSALNHSALTNTTDLNKTDLNVSSSSSTKTPPTRTPSPSLERQINDALRLSQRSEEEGAVALAPPQPNSSSSSNTSNPGLHLIESNYS